MRCANTKMRAFSEPSTTLDQNQIEWTIKYRSPYNFTIPNCEFILIPTSLLHAELIYRVFNREVFMKRRGQTQGDTERT